MKHYITYEIKTGDLIGTSEAPAPPEMPEGYGAIECEWVAQPWRYQVVDGVVIERGTPIDPPAASAPPPERFSFNQWVDLFPFAEQVAIVSAAMTDPVAKLIYDRAQSASGNIDPTDPRTIQGLQYLVSKGWVSEATLARITAA